MPCQEQPGWAAHEVDALNVEQAAGVPVQHMLAQTHEQGAPVVPSVLAQVLIDWAQHALLAAVVLGSAQQVMLMIVPILAVTPWIVTGRVTVASAGTGIVPVAVSVTCTGRGAESKPATEYE